MNIESCIAHAINSDLDILAAFPELENLPIDELESTVEHYVRDIQSKLQTVILQQGDTYLRAKDAAGLCATCLHAGVLSQRPQMLLRICQTIVQLASVDARFIVENDGKNLFYVKMAIA